MRSAAAIVLVLVLVAQPAVALSAPGAPAGVDESPETAAPMPDAATAAVASSPTISVDTALSLTPDDPGSIGVVQTFRTPDEVSELRVTLDAESTVTATVGFQRVDERTWAWDGETAEPRLRYDKAANRTVSGSGPMGADGSYLFVDTGEWALVRQPNVRLEWWARDTVDVNRTTRVDGEGAVGGTMAFLGAHELHTRQVAGQEIRLVVPAAADLADPPATVLDGLGNASRALRVGDRDPSVFAVAAPTGEVGWAVQGLQTGEADFWARASRPVDGVGSTWLHEYVHTRQAFRTTESARWFTEASATWYAALLGYRESGSAYREFSQYLARGTARPQSDSVLTDPASWENNANYWKGALVSGDIDRRIRLATDGGATLQRVVAALNDRTTPVTNRDLLATVADVATADQRAAADRYTGTDETPEVWNQSIHRDAFGGGAALIRAEVDPAGDVYATGPYRDRGVSPPVTLAAGERLAVRTTVENLGSATGDYDIGLRVDDAPVASDNGTLAPGETETVSLVHRFSEPGRYVVSVGGERFEVRVGEPATPTVTDVTVEPASVQRGGQVTVIATVTNDDAVPGNATLTFGRNGEQVTTRTVTVGPGEQVVVTSEVTMPETGSHHVSVAGTEIDVRVGERASDTPDTTRTSIPGFGAVVALVAIGAAIAGRRRSGP
ncbi:hypothetical protein JCM30237_28280 [Halolamina litorea]|uniref:PGF-CTERM sorting domain-containing protein n=1 Tax=Halolamina litorea TaxID=1515593 RepID=A0ABD6BT15_9EURY|nr:PGF-CTERM sorting domain-containing protein [Halolamina litorea]